MKALFKKIILDTYDGNDNEILSIENSDPNHPHIHTSHIFVIFKFASKLLLFFDKMNPSDGKRPKRLIVSPVYPKFALTYKWRHFTRLCSSCGFVGHLAPTCPLQRIFMSKDIWNIRHTDPLSVDFVMKEESYIDNVIVPDTLVVDAPDVSMDRNIETAPVLCVDTTASFCSVETVIIFVTYVGSFVVAVYVEGLDECSRGGYP
eukprot:TRINITY_DN567_c0_g1_i3.p1 TRINITY_DN567_c0_g1~~TRINITY_DN567_c0_g1_i3.p1  ORF type:complete len:204 (-),score=14.70 TRINITY_DN567_c0_g1_i3:4-615(-)